MADPDEALIEAIAEALRTVDDAALVETNFGQISATYDDAARAALAAMDKHLGLVEERSDYCDGCAGVIWCETPERHKRRLVSRWTEVDR